MSSEKREERKIEIKTVEQLVDMFNYVKVDYRIQRKGGLFNFGGWDDAGRKSYIKSLLNDRVLNSISLVDITKTLDCLQKSQERKKYREDIKYFKSLQDGGFSYLSIDGNNTHDTIYHFVHDKIENDEQKKFSQLEPSTKSDFYNTEIAVNILSGLTKSECCAAFKACNTNEELNAQQRRRATLTDFASWIFNSNNTWAEILNYFSLSEKDIGCHLGEETIAMLYAELVDREKINKDGLNDLYEETNKPNSAIVDRINNIFKHLKECQSKIENKDEIGTEKCAKEKSPKKEKFKPLKRTVFLTYMLCLDDYINVNKKKVDSLKFLNKFLSFDALFYEESEKITKEEQEEKSWSFWLGNFSLGRRLQKCKDKMLSSLLENEDEFLLDSGRTNSERFTQRQHSILIELQGGKDRKGNPIDQIDRHLGRTEVDHVTPVSMGGKTTMENAEVMTKKDNRKKGTKENQPVFPHQMKCDT